MSAEGIPGPEARGSAAETPAQKGVEQRRYPRYDFAATAHVRILVEEETFNPMRFAAQTCNISRGGMLLRIESMPENQYRMLIHRQRMVRVHLRLPESEGETVFFGRIVWYDFRCLSGGASCLLGISFDNLRGKEEGRLEGLLVLLATGTPPAAPR